jgi:hypothetical protein
VATLAVWVGPGLAEVHDPSRAHASGGGGFYCETHIIEPGVDAYRVRAWCGPPAMMQPRLEVRRQLQAVRVPCARGYCDSFVEREISVAVDEWVYDFGPTRFVRFLTFEQGTLIRVRSGPYGTKEGQRASDSDVSGP